MTDLIELPKFRWGNTLPTRFTGTLTERYGEPHEHVPSPARFIQWLHANDLPVATCTPPQLAWARRLREALHVALSAVALEQSIPEAARSVINKASERGRAIAALTSSGERAWVLRPTTQLDDALGVIARDAIELLSGQGGGRLSVCASSTCRAVFLDASRGHTRRWCDMNTCGNRQKKARYRSSR